MKSIKKIAAVAMAAVICLGLLTSCAGSSDVADNSIVIWTSGEDYKNQYYLDELEKKFPDYDFTMEYMNSSTIAAKVLEEGENCSCDIILSEEYGYLYKCEDYLAELTDFDFSVFLDDIVPANHKFTPEVKNGGCVIFNSAVLELNGVEKPTSYQDLLDPKYEGLISMPSPASSGTGYMFLRQLTNEWGEDEAFKYFEDFSKNVLQYTSSGSGPVNALVQGEVAVGLGMTAQAVTAINDGADLKILFFEEGSPYSLYGYAIPKGKETRKAVVDVFNFFYTTLVMEDKELYYPEQVFVGQVNSIENYPTDIPYADMSGNTTEEKTRLMENWEY